ncbi:WD40-repeat-containing domain protein [Suillus spraguei]|nr:WD40-repeat-containing domain protein [Suillus spraguei]
MSESGLLTSSIQYGVVARSLPLNGKVLKGYLDAAGTGLGIGNPNVEFTPNVSACRLTSDGGTARVFWGKRNGEVAVTTAARVMDPGRASAKLVECKVEDQHDGIVNEIAWDPTVSRFVSGGADGQVKLWDSKTVACLWSSDKQLESLVVDPFLKVSSALADGIIAGALSSGDIILWTSSQQVHSEDFSSPASFVQHRIASPISKGQPFPQDAFIPKPQPTVLCVCRHSQTTAALLIGYSDHLFFYRVFVELTSGKYETTAFGDPSFGYNSIVEPIFAAQPGDCSFIITGDLLGSVGIYDWDTPQTSSSVVPARRFEAYEDSAVTALAWSSVVFATGSARGTVTIWDALTLEPLRLFSSPIPRTAPGREIGGVSNIVIEKELLVIIVDNRVMSWKVGQAHHHRDSAPHKSKRLRANRNTISKGQQRYDLHKVINESKRELEQEKSYARHTMGREREQRSTLNMLGLSESEAVEYVLMLSREEEEHHRSSNIVDEGVFQADFEDETFLPTASSPSVMHGYANQSSPGAFYDHHSRTYPRAARSLTNEKVQVSPVFVPEPMEAGVTISPLRIPKSLPGSSAGTRSLPEMARSTSSSTEHFPSISSSISSSTSSLEHIHSAWSTPLRSPPPSHGASSPCVGTPILRTASASFSSASMENHGRDSEEELRAPLDLDEMDEELKFAIELSLAEARSRSEV